MTSTRWLAAMLFAISGAASLTAQGRTPSRSTLEAAVVRDSNDPVLLYQLGDAYLRERRVPDAKRAFFTAIRIDPQFAPAYAALARIALASRPLAILLRVNGGYVLIGPRRPGNDSSVVLLQQAFMLNPLVEIRPADQWPFPEFWEGTIQRALHHFHDEDYRGARNLLDTVLMKMKEKNDTNPRIASVRWFRLLSSASLAEYDEAINDGELLLDHALREEIADSTHPNERRSGEYEWVLAHLHQRARHFDEAERLYQRAAARDLGEYMAHVELANIYEAENRWEDAIVERQRAIDANPGDASLEFQAGLTLVSAGHPAEADSLLRRVILDDPRETRAYYVLGLADGALSRTEDARAMFQRFLQLAPTRYDAMITDARRRLAALQ